MGRHRHFWNVWDWHSDVFLTQFHQRIALVLHLCHGALFLEALILINNSQRQNVFLLFHLFLLELCLLWYDFLCTSLFIAHDIRKVIVEQLFPGYPFVDIINQTHSDEILGFLAHIINLHREFPLIVLDFHHQTI